MVDWKLRFGMEWKDVKMLTGRILFVCFFFLSFFFSFKNILLEGLLEFSLRLVKGTSENYG